ncbi:MAG TPA: PQQ-binding-like beta-propeller repeat protein [Micromonosporaceae bacterium]|jgi:hypothetical protein|nr:PQQ-binding-like beta-propeller repeat protein [Micromonosporaceae bacterium]
MPNWRVVCRFAVFVCVATLVVLYFVLTHTNPLPRIVSWLDEITATSLSKPAGPWAVRAGDQPDSATVVPGAIVVSAAGSVEARNPGSGKRLWTLDDSWATVGGGSNPVVVVGHPAGGGFDVVAAASGEHLWSDNDRDAVWAFSDVILILHCPHQSNCQLQADDPTSGKPQWRTKLDGAGSSMRGLGGPFATLQPIAADYAKSLGAVPSAVPTFVGLNLGGDVHVISTARKREVRVYPAGKDQRVVVAGNEVIVATSAPHAGTCTYTIQGRDAATNATRWTRTGFNPHTTSGLACDQRNDPKGAGGALLATDTSGRDVLLNVGTGALMYRAPAGAHIVATDGAVALARLADGKTLQAADAESGAPLWQRPVTKDALVGVGSGVVMIADPVNGRMVAVKPESGAVMLNVASGATVLGVGANYLVVNIGRTFGPLLLSSGQAAGP